MEYLTIPTSNKFLQINLPLIHSFTSLNMNAMNLKTFGEILDRIGMIIMV
jgi:hypothetical protein